jgi:hypothetical protein
MAYLECGGYAVDDTTIKIAAIPLSVDSQEKKL